MENHASESFEKKSSFKGTLVFIIFLILIRSFLFSPFRIPSGSMIPALEVGDLIISSKYAYGWSRYSMLGGGHLNYTSARLETGFPKRGDILIFAYPSDTRTDFIKRVIGLPGDTIQMIQGRLHINGTEIPLEKVQEKYTDHDGYSAIEGTLYTATIPGENKPITYRILKQDPFGQGKLDNTPPIKVPEGSVFCMGDNWDGSDDSRNLDKLGCVSKEFFVGKALFVLVSVDIEKISLFKPWTWIYIPFKIRFNRFFNPL
jgi:signal peptidase I